jgi:hypothetical protein
MSRSEFYCQCKLRWPLENGSEKIDYSWIPSELAKIGLKVRLRTDSDAEYEDWIVAEVYDRKPYEDLVKNERDWKNQRGASDI